MSARKLSLGVLGLVLEVIGLIQMFAAIGFGPKRGFDWIALGLESVLPPQFGSMGAGIITFALGLGLVVAAIKGRQSPP